MRKVNAHFHIMAITRLRMRMELMNEVGNLNHNRIHTNALYIHANSETYGLMNMFIVGIHRIINHLQELVFRPLL